MNILDYRKQFPGLRPYILCKHKDGRFVECISWAFEENGTNYIYIRKPGFPSTHEKIEIKELIALQATCPCTMEAFTPRISIIKNTVVIVCSDCNSIYLYSLVIRDHSYLRLQSL